MTAPPFRALQIAAAPPPDPRLRSWYVETRMTAALMRDESAARAFLLGCTPDFVKAGTATVTMVYVDPDGYDPEFDSWRVIVYGKGEAQ